jgi:hypothetical protein
MESEFIRNARRNVIIAYGLSPLGVSYTIHANWAHCYYRMYLESTGAKNINKMVSRLFASENVEGALALL